MLLSYLVPIGPPLPPRFPQGNNYFPWDNPYDENKSPEKYKIYAELSPLVALTRSKSQNIAVEKLPFPSFGEWKITNMKDCFKLRFDGSRERGGIRVNFEFLTELDTLTTKPHASKLSVYFAANEDEDSKALSMLVDLSNNLNKNYSPKKEVPLKVSHSELNRLHSKAKLADLNTSFDVFKRINEILKNDNSDEKTESFIRASKKYFDLLQKDLQRINNGFNKEKDELFKSHLDFYSKQNINSLAALKEEILEVWNNFSEIRDFIIQFPSDFRNNNLEIDELGAKALIITKQLLDTINHEKLQSVDSDEKTVPNFKDYPLEEKVATLKYQSGFYLNNFNKNIFKDLILECIYEQDMESFKKLKITNEIQDILRKQIQESILDGDAKFFENYYDMNLDSSVFLQEEPGFVTAFEQALKDGSNINTIKPLLKEIFQSNYHNLSWKIGTVGEVATLYLLTQAILKYEGDSKVEKLILDFTESLAKNNNYDLTAQRLKKGLMGSIKIKREQSFKILDKLIEEGKINNHDQDNNKLLIDNLENYFLDDSPNYFEKWLNILQKLDIQIPKDTIKSQYMFLINSPNSIINKKIKDLILDLA